MTGKNPVDLNTLSNLAELFKLFNGGKHLNRVADLGLWTELEQEADAYQSLFQSLGYELRIDRRGFAWFHNDEASSNITKTTRQLALLFLVVFEYQADAGHSLHRFDTWLIDRALLKAIFEQYQERELLTAEELDVEGLEGLLETAVRYGFAVAESGGWRLLPAVYRYLDHFEELARQTGQGDMDAQGVAGHDAEQEEDTEP